MAAGPTLYSDISARVADIRAKSVVVARMANKLIPTIYPQDETGLAPRKVDIYSAATFTERGEDDEISPQKFAKSALSTITPAQFAAGFRITDARAATDFDPAMADASIELGAAAAKYVDKKIATNFSSVTGGTIGNGAGSISWAKVTSALALLQNQDIPEGMPVYCALHPYQWSVLLEANTVAGATVGVAPAFQDRMVTSGGFFSIPEYVGVTFVVTNSITITSGTAAYGCIYVPPAFTVDTRKAFDIEPKRVAEREATDLYATMWFGHGTWRPEWAIAIYTLANTPS